MDRLTILQSRGFGAAEKSTFQVVWVYNMMNLTNPLKYMNTSYVLSRLIFPIHEDLDKKARSTVFHMAAQESNHIQADPQKFEKIRNIYINVFNHKLDNEIISFSEKKRLFKPIDYITPLRDVLFNLIEQKVKLCLVNSPENEFLIEKWNDFRKSYATLSFNRDSDFFNFMNLSLDFFQTEIEKSTPPTTHEELLASNSAFNLLRDALTRDIDFLKVPIAYFLGLSRTEDLQISVDHLIEANDLLVDKCLQDFPWVLNIIENDLKKFENLNQDGILIFSKILSEKITNFKKIFLNQIHTLYIKDRRFCSKINMEFVKSLEAEINKWEYNNDFNASFKVCLDNSVNNENHFVFTLDSGKYFPSFCPIELLIAMFDRCQKDIEEVQKLKQEGKNIPKDKKNLLHCYNKYNIDSLNNCLEFHRSIIKWDILLRTYFYINVTQLVWISTAIHEWFSGLPPQLKRKVTSQSKIDDPESSSNHFQSKPLTVEEMKLFEQPSKTITPRKRKARKKKSFQKNSPSTKENFSEKVSESNTSKSPPILSRTPQTSFHHQQAIHLLSYIIQNSKTSSKETISHAHMHLQDLIVIDEALQNATDHSSRVFFLISMIQSAFFVLEQLIKHHAGGEIEYHNLIRLMKETGLESIIENKDLIYELFLANYWVREPYEQIDKRRSWSIPSLLMDIKEIYENKISQQTVNKVRAYIHTIPQFMCIMPALKKISATVKPVTDTPNVEKFSPSIKFENKKILSTLEVCEKILNLNLKSMPSNIQNKFKQAILHLKILNSIVHELSKEHIPSNLFSFLIRSLPYWANTALEEILETLYFFKTGKDFASHSHRLETLWEKIPWSKQPKEKYFEFLRENFHNLHNITRYPFSYRDPNPLLKVILRGEQLRNSPELGLDQPYLLVEGKSKMQNRSDLTPTEICLKLQDTLNKVVNIIGKRLLPEFENQFA